MSSLFIFFSPTDGTAYAFCTRECQREWATSEEEHKPDNLNEKWGCWWCGKSVYPGGEEAWENPANRLV